MGVFQNIDPKLKALADSLDARLTIDRNMGDIYSFEERRIDWVENEINKAIIIQPTFEAGGVDSSRWNFINLAWIKKNGLAIKRGHHITLIKEKDFEVIENGIDELLNTSVANLKSVDFEKLKSEST